MKDIGSLFKNAMKMQETMTEMNSKLESIEVIGSAGGGMVKVFLSGKAIVKNIKIDQSVVDPREVEVLEDLLVAAMNNAKLKLEEKMKEEMGNLAGGLTLPPGIKLPF
tara:strand:+ start:68 stop:391 length:324 start_codon:yes stop_codon:yes gene_type:complete